MKITSVEMTNFRNVESATYFFNSDRCAIRGKNHIGKTNALQAIYWVLADALLENTEDYDSFIPHSDNRAMVKVKLTFDDGKTFTKTYAEKWTRTRGQTEEKLTGHETRYYLNEMEISKVSSAQATIHEIILGTDNFKKAFGLPVDLYKTLINPLYLFGQEDWKKVRTFIIGLVGDIKDEDVFNAKPTLKKIQADLNTMGGRTDNLATKYRQDIASFSKELSTIEIETKVNQDKVNANQVSNDEIAKADEAKEKYNNDIANIKANKVGNPMLDDVNKRINSISATIATLNTEINDEERAYFSDYSKQRDEAENNYIKASNKVSELKKNIDDFTESKGTLTKKINETQTALDRAKEKKTLLTSNYIATKHSEFTFKEEKCPYCGEVLNRENEEKARSEFENHKSAELLRITNDGTANNTEITRLQALIDSYNKQLAESDDSAKEALEVELARASKDKELKLEMLNSITPKKSAKRDTLKSLNDELSILNAQKAQIATSESDDVNQRVSEYVLANANVSKFISEVTSKMFISKDATDSIAKLALRKTSVVKDLGDVEEKKEILNQFILAKLSMVNESTKKIFPDIEFVLIENNIKEGSFNEVCYPLIKGKKTPFLDGSNSERILTGIAIIEDIRHFLGIEPLTIIFDEGETLDSDSIRAIESESQVITTIVDDNYITPTEVDL